LDLEASLLIQGTQNASVKATELMTLESIYWRKDECDAKASVRSV